MLRRCYKKEDASYGRYGGRGIRVAGRWRRCFANFFADMGACPIGLSLNRKNNEEGYSKDNCNWATPKEQARNTRNNVVMEGFGKVKCISEWAEDPRCVVGLSLLRYRLDRQGWPLAQAMMMPPRKSWSRRRGDRSYKEAG